MVARFGSERWPASRRCRGPLQHRNAGPLRVGIPGPLPSEFAGVDRATTLNYWKPNSGGFGALAVLQIPVRSEAPFIVDRGSEGAVDAAIVADPVKFEAAANDVINQALPKFISVMVVNR